MNTREPDWAYAARSLIKVLVVASALFLALNVVERVLWLFGDFDDKRTAQVYGTAARVANPDKYLSPGHSDGGLLETTHTMWGTPRRAGPSDDETKYEITEDLFGAVRAPSLNKPSSSLFNAIDAVSAEPGVDEQLKKKVAKTIDGLPQTLRAVGVVEFAHSMTAEQLVAFNRRHEICEGNVSYIYATSFFDDSSEVPSMNAVVWNRYMNEESNWEDVPYRCETEPVPALAEFRRWVGLLDEGDDLEEFELYRGRLVGTAKEGVVYGLVVDGWKLGDLRKLLDSPEVRTIDLTDVAFDFHTDLE